MSAMMWLSLALLLVSVYVVHSSNGVSPKVASNAVFRDLNAEKENKSIQRQEREQLYEAYNQLHTLAQDFHKPFDAPAVIVVGHQTSGKSALIEALMGFQFNQVGGGTKTRRPVALRMQYNPSCTSPMCFLTTENGKEEQRSLADIQAYIEAENKRLERDPTRCFDSKEINIRMEYRYCPNMIVIDTPGMLHPPKGKQLTTQQRALQQAAREAEALVLSKIKCQDYIILCVEDTTDWKHATTRNVVMQADPELSRTVLVTTKLDTKLPQFSEADDLEDFLKAPLVHKIFPRILGGPFFTTVPCGRVGVDRDYSSNEAFVKGLRKAEAADRFTIGNKMDQTKARESLVHVGVTRLRSFLESRVEECYRRNVAKIVPLLQSELRHTESRLGAIETELSALSVERLKQSAAIYRERFSKELANAIHGTVKASPEDWGETLESEQLRGGSFMDQEQLQTDSWQRLIEIEVGNSKHKLFGGAQYHRAMREFTVAAKHMRTPLVTEDEIANAAGMGDVHDGVNFMRAACVIAVEKAQQSFEPMLESLRHRTTHIMRRLFPVVESIVKRNSKDIPVDNYSQQFQEMIRRAYDKFVDQHMEQCLQKCRDDIKGMTRFITWDVDGKGGSSALYRSLPTPKKMVEIYSVAVDTRSQKSIKKGVEQPQKSKKNAPAASHKSAGDKIYDEWANANGISSGSNSNNREVVATNAQSTVVTPINKQWDDDQTQLSDYYDLLQLTEEMLAGRNANRTNTVVTALVQYIIRSWREHFARTVAMKFNCFFMMPFMDDFPVFLRDEMEKMYAENYGELFDISEARAALQTQKSELLAECEANSKLQKRFDLINAQLRSSQPPSTSNKIESNDENIEVDVESS